MEFESLKSLRLHGFSKFLHGLFLLITYPLRHPFKFLLIVALLILFAFLFLNEDNPKLLNKIEQKKDTVFKETPVADAQTAPKKFGKKFALKHAEPVAQETEKKPEESEAVETKEETKYQVWNINKEGQAQAPKQEQVLEEIKSLTEVKNIETQPQEKEYLSDTDCVNCLPLKEKCTNCVHLEPEIISGQAIVYGPTELYVADTYLYLYGIESDPLKYDAEKAKIYLRELINSEKVECKVVLKTTENIPSAICFRADKNINKSMVEAGFADNTAF